MSVVGIKTMDDAKGHGYSRGYGRRFRAVQVFRYWRGS